MCYLYQQHWGTDSIAIWLDKFPFDLTAKKNSILLWFKHQFLLEQLFLETVQIPLICNPAVYLWLRGMVWRVSMRFIPVLYAWLFSHDLNSGCHKSNVSAHTEVGISDAGLWVSPLLVLTEQYLSGLCPEHSLVNQNNTWACFFSTTTYCIGEGTYAGLLWHWLCV